MMQHLSGRSDDWTPEELVRLIELELERETPNERIVLWAEVLLATAPDADQAWDADA